MMTQYNAGVVVAYSIVYSLYTALFNSFYGHQGVVVYSL